MIAASGLTKLFGRVAALRAVDVTAATGEAVAVLGANGAGKTTLLRLLATLDKPSAGSISVGGVDAVRQPQQARAAIGVVAHQTFLHPELTALEDLRFYARLYGLARAAERARQLLEMVGLAGRAGSRISDLSRGQQQRLAIARALLHDPPVLLLDEPDTGLDAEGVRFLEGVIRSGERTVLFSSHNRAWAASIASRTLTLDNGRVLTPDPGLT